MELRRANIVSHASTNYKHVAQHIPYGLFINPPIHCTTLHGFHTPTRKAPRLIIKASTSGDYKFDSDHSMVDGDMIVLRKRIFELKMQESENELPIEWMEWERKMYPTYNSLVFYAIAWAQYFLMTARPGVAVGILTLFSLSLPASLFFVTLGGVKCMGEFIAHLHVFNS